MEACISPSPSPCFTGGFFPIFVFAEGCDDAFLLTSVPENIIHKAIQSSFLNHPLFQTGIHRRLSLSRLHSCRLSAMGCRTEKTAKISSTWQNDSIRAATSCRFPSLCAS